MLAMIHADEEDDDKEDDDDNPTPHVGHDTCYAMPFTSRSYVEVMRMSNEHTLLKRLESLQVRHYTPK